MSYRKIKDKYLCPDCNRTFWLDVRLGEPPQCPECECVLRDEDWLDRDEIELYTYDEMHRLTRP